MPARCDITETESSRQVILLEQMIEYIRQKYNPLSIILYGSYASGTNNLNSDFDALVITSDSEPYHDTSFVNNIPLDVFVYPKSRFSGNYDCEEFIRIFDGIIVMDSNDIGKSVQNRVQTFLQNRPNKTDAEIQADTNWCAKMLERVKRCDAEGMFRWHWLLVDSLEIFFDIIHEPYFGPKKALKWMEENQPTAFEIYQKALTQLNIESLENWILYIKNAVQAGE